MIDMIVITFLWPRLVGEGPQVGRIHRQDPSVGGSWTWHGWMHPAPTSLPLPNGSLPHNSTYAGMYRCTEGLATCQQQVKNVGMLATVMNVQDLVCFDDVATQHTFKNWPEDSLVPKQNSKPCLLQARTSDSSSDSGTG